MMIYLNITWFMISIPISPITETSVSMSDQDKNVCLIDNPKYSLNSQKYTAKKNQYIHVSALMRVSGYG